MSMSPEINLGSLTISLWKSIVVGTPRIMNSSRERFRRAIAYITQDLITRTIFLPEDERTRDTLVDYFMVLRDEETADFLFDDPELMDMTAEFRECASILFDGCDVTRTGGISAEDRTHNIEKMKALAARIRDRTMQYP